MSSAKATKKNYTEEAARILRQEITLGKLRPNERLVELAIAGTLGMSRTPVREALKILVTQGYVSKLNNGKLIVTDPSATQIIEIYEVREALEAMAIRLVCARATQEQIDRATQYHEMIYQIAKDRDITQYIRVNSKFHNVLLSACANGILFSLINTYRDLYLDRRLVKVFTARDWRNRYLQHKQILEGVRQRDVKKAEKAVRDHISSALKLALERL